MKRPRTLRDLLLLCLLLLIGWWTAATFIASVYVRGAIQRASGGSVSVERIHLSPSLQLTLTGVRLATNTAQAGLSVQRMVIAPRWVSPATKQVWLSMLRLEHPVVRVTRTGNNAVLWPAVPPHGQPSSTWRIHLDSVKIVEGVVEAIDEKPTPSFHGTLDHISSEAGGLLTIPWSGSQFQFALRGVITGHAGHGAPAYCSGWADVAQKDFHATCRLEPLPLVAFDPYFHGPTELRVYTTTLRSTSQWGTAADELTARIQLELNHLSEGDLSVRGRTIADIKRLIASDDPRLRGELTINGPLDDPSRWYAEFLPGDDVVQQLIKRLLNRGVEMVKVPFFGRKLPVNITPASEAKMTDIEAASREVQEALELLTLPEPEVAPAAAPDVEPVPPTQEATPATEQAAPAGEPSTPPAAEEATPTAPEPPALPPATAPSAPKAEPERVSPVTPSTPSPTAPGAKP